MITAFCRRWESNSQVKMPQLVLLGLTLQKGLVAPDLGIFVKDFYFSVSGFSCYLNWNIFHSVAAQLQCPVTYCDIYKRQQQSKPFVDLEHSWLFPSAMGEAGITAFLHSTSLRRMSLLNWVFSGCALTDSQSPPSLWQLRNSGSLSASSANKNKSPTCLMLWGDENRVINGLLYFYTNSTPTAFLF